MRSLFQGTLSSAVSPSPATAAAPAAAPSPAPSPALSPAPSPGFGPGSVLNLGLFLGRGPAAPAPLATNPSPSPAISFAPSSSPPSPSHTAAAPSSAPPPSLSPPLGGASQEAQGIPVVYPPSPARLSVEAWDPQPGKYLLARCLYGRLTNQVFCMRSYLELAQALNRSLLIPTWGVAANLQRVIDYKFRWDVAVDWKRMQRCLAPRHGPVAVLTVEDYLSIHRTERVNVSLFAALSRPKTWAVQGGVHVQEWQNLNSEILFPSWDEIPGEPLLRNLTQPERPTPEDVWRGAGRIQDSVITFGEMYNTGMRPKPPIPVIEAPDCLNLWRCHPAIMEFVRGIGDAKLGGSYAALHLRRGDFYGYLSKTGKYHGAELAHDHGFRSIQDVGVQMRQELEKRGVARLFVATNARKLELDILKAVIKDSDSPGKVQDVLTLHDVLEEREWLEQQPWAKAALALERSPEGHGLVLPLVDKFMCVRANHFFGSRGSTFSFEIDYFLRHDEWEGPRKS